MPRFPTLFVVAAWTLAGTVHAESLVSSTASLTSSAASSASDSLGASSNSSTRTAQAAPGDYRIEAIAAAERPGKTRLVLQHTERAGDDGRLVLDLPSALVQAEALAAGALLRVQPREYGLAFAKPQHAPFFLVLADDWHDGLVARPVKL